MSVNEIIKNLRTDKGMTQNDLANKLNCNRQKIADWERGKSTPSADDLILLSNIFNVSSDYLLGISPAPTTDKNVQFICDYTGLEVESIEYLNGSITRIMHNLLDFLISGKGKEDFFDMCVFFDDYKVAYQNLVKHKEEMIDNYVSLPIDCKQANDIVMLSDTLNDKKDLLEFKIKKAITNLLIHYCEEEFKKDMQIKNDYQKLYEYLKYTNDFELYEKYPERMGTVDRLAVKITNKLLNETGDDNANNPKT